MPTRTLPHDLDAESALIGSILFDAGVLDLEALIDLTPSDFFASSNADIYAAMQALSKKGQPITLITLRDALKSAGKPFDDCALIKLTELAPVVGHASAYARSIREKSRMRKVAKALQRSQQTALDPTSLADLDAAIDLIETEIFTATNRSDNENTCAPVAKIVDGIVKKTTRAVKDGESFDGESTGIRALDEKTGGLIGGDLIVVAGRPGMGKSALASGISLSLAERALPNLFFSLEMPRDRLTERLISTLSGIDGYRIRAQRLWNTELTDYMAACNRLSKMNLEIDDRSGATVSYVRSVARRIKRKYAGLGLIVVDYLQLMSPSRRTDNREQAIAEISRSLKSIAKDLNVPVIAISQLNRGVETRGLKDRHPQLSDLRESGAIEQDADQVWLIYRDEIYERTPENAGKAEIIIAKNRYGATGKVHCRFDAATTGFSDLSDYQDSEYRGAVC